MRTIALKAANIFKIRYRVTNWSTLCQVAIEMRFRSMKGTS